MRFSDSSRDCRGARASPLNAEMYRRYNYAKHHLMNAYGRLFGTKVLSLRALYKARVSYLHCGRQNFQAARGSNEPSPPAKPTTRVYAHTRGTYIA
jgi:hypothetical protein